MLLMERFKWTWDDLMSTPSDVIARILVMWDVESRVSEAERNVRAATSTDGYLST